MFVCPGAVAVLTLLVLLNIPEVFYIFISLEKFRINR